ncbi:MAG: transketolase [Candidatus Firestonebacteria bacterium RIFOXYA2_FULL_40_8]|nr:MAG: transketolase [Candidatus Firestonebacteria bacterium RIFOXYA2_FULL_40_8]
MYQGKNETPDIKKLEEHTVSIRKGILLALNAAGSGHPGGSLSMVEFITALYFAELRHDPKNPKWDKRDRVFLSKGHAVPGLYSVLAECGYFPKEELVTLRKLHSRLQGHPHSAKTPGIEISAGSLGQGLGAANGAALGLRLDGSDSRVFCIMGDGELQEGSVWEAIMTSAHRKLDNVVAWVDYNNLQIDGTIEDVKGLAPLAAKFKAFNWHVINVDGHSIEAHLKAFKEARATKGKPTVLIAKTIKGKGVCFMENKAEWHGVAPNNEQLEAALKDLCVVNGPSKEQVESADV